MSNPAPSPVMTLLQHGIPLTLLLDLIHTPDSRSLLEGERLTAACPPAP